MSAFDDFEPSLTYDRTSGSVNVPTSQDGTAHADVSGITNKAQRYALILAGQRGARGVTVAELRELHGSVHHGRVSAALTNLHRDGRLVALTQRRDHCGIYVLPEYVDGRETRTFRPNRRTLDRDEIRDILESHAATVISITFNPACTCGWERWSGGITHRDHLADVLAEALR